MAVPDVFTALASPVRRQILEMLLKGPSTVNVLVEAFQLNRPAVSEHLQVLRLARLVRDERHGRERHYHLEPKRFDELQAWLKLFERYWQERMQALNDTLNEEDQ